jgi:predicted 3-demethylubiquinone-9 3-methyltransferase (glyoxalase superfamily)
MEVRHSPFDVAIALLKSWFMSGTLPAKGRISAIVNTKLKKMATIQKITTNLWFNDQAEDAARFYTSVFKNSRIGKTTRYGKEGYEIHKMPEGSVMTIEFWLNDQAFVGLNGGPIFKFNESISFIINCETQEEIDYYWNTLSEGGDPKSQVCGWLKDKYGLSWQVVPSILSELISDGDKEKSGRAMKAMLQMKKLDIDKLKKAAEGQEISV